jgi:hypothetical protein
VRGAKAWSGAPARQFSRVRRQAVAWTQLAAANARAVDRRAIGRLEISEYPSAIPKDETSVRTGTTRQEDRIGLVPVLAQPWHSRQERGDTFWHSRILWPAKIPIADQPERAN